MKLIPNKLTKLSTLEVLQAFIAAFVTITGSKPGRSTLAILTAQSALECGRWLSMHCFNFGNMRPPLRWPGNYCQFRCNEKIKGIWVWFDPPNAGSNFLAFETAADGAEYYMAKLRERWPEAWAAALVGDSTGFVHGLKQRGYFTADETPYRVAVQRMCAEFLAYMSRGLLGPEYGDLPDAHEPAWADIHASVAEPVIIAPALLIGARGPAVAVWQRIVGADPDGDFGEETESKTKSWQLQHGLPVTGAVCEPDLEVAGLADPDTRDTDPIGLAPAEEKVN